MIFNEEAKAVQEVAKTTGKGIDLISQIGSVFSDPIKEGIGILHDNIIYKRWENQQEIAKKVRKKQEEYGGTYEIKPIEFKLAVPFLEAATLDEDDFIQELWANLLINSSYKESGIELNRTYIDILEKLSPLEAKILLKIYSFPVDKILRSGVLTVYLPEKAICYSDIEVDGYEYELTNKSVLVALANLNRMDCLTPRAVFGGKQRFEVVFPTIMGEYFVKSCTINYDEMLTK